MQARSRIALLLVVLAVVLTAAVLLRPPRDSDEQAEGASDAALRSLPYLTWVSSEETADKKGVTVHDTDRAHPGLNLYSPRESHRAFLIDMEGAVVHRWDTFIDEPDTWQLVEPVGDGELLVITPNRRLLRIDRDSEILWRLDRRVHHDVAVAASGELYVLAREETRAERPTGPVAVLDDVILRISAEGEIVDRLSIHALFGDLVAERSWQLLERWLRSPAAEAEMAENATKTGFRLQNGKPPDLYHTNSIEILDRDIPGVTRAGALLISIREISTVAIVDFEARRVDWAWGRGVIRRQHHPSLLDDGRILVYDNLGGRGGRTRVLEVDPTTNEIVWEYNGEPPEAFFSALRGGCQRLPNGNTLITESDRGRVFEITRAGEIVWEFYNPVTRAGGSERSAIYRMSRLAPDDSWVDSLLGR